MHGVWKSPPSLKCLHKHHSSPLHQRLTLQTRNKLQPPKAVTLLQLSTAQATWNTRHLMAGDQNQTTFCCKTSSTLPFADIPESFLICLLHLCFLLSVQCCWLFSRKLSWLQSRFYMQQKAGFFLPLSTPHPFQPLSSLIQPFLGGKGQAIILTPEASFKSFSTSCTLNETFGNQAPSFFNPATPHFHPGVLRTNQSPHTQRKYLMFIWYFTKVPKKFFKGSLAFGFCLLF